MKSQIDEYIKHYGNENTPPPWQTFTIGNEVREGNVHLIQKVFEGAFEVSILGFSRSIIDTNAGQSSTYCIHLGPRLNH